MEAHRPGRARVFRIVASLVVILIAAGVCVAAFAQWSSASAALPDSMFSSGSRAVAGGCLRMGDHQVVPGGSVTGSAVVTNTGDAAGRFFLRATTTAGDTAPRIGLGSALRVTVTDVTGVHESVYEGSLSGLSDVDLGRFAPGATRTYEIVVTLPAESSDSCSGSTAFGFDWTAVTQG